MIVFWRQFLLILGQLDLLHKLLQKGLLPSSLMKDPKQSCLTFFQLMQTYITEIQSTTEILSSIYAEELKKAKKLFDQCVAFSIQIDGSVSKHMRDHKFVNCRIVIPNGEYYTEFMIMHSPDERGALGLLQVANKALCVCEADEKKLMGITTDGEAANTGRESGLWKLLSDQCNINILTFWCFAHRSDLAMESIIQTVPELKIWKSSLTGVETYFRTSTVKKC